MHLNKLIILLISLLLAAALVPAGAEDSDTVPPLELHEITELTERILSMAGTMEPIVTPAGADDYTDDGYAFVYDFGTLYMDRPQMSGDSVLLSYVISGEDVMACRDTCVQEPLSALLASFTSENPALVGDYDHAVLYLYDDPDAVLWAWVARDGQRVLNVQYSVHALLEDGSYTDTGLLYTMESGFVDTIRVYGINSRISAADVHDTLSYVRRSAVQTAYSAVVSSYDGESLLPFSGEDLVFSGLDFLHASPEDVISLLGNSLEDNEMQDSDGSTLRMMDFGACEVYFRYGNGQTNPVIASITVSQDLFEGPRAIRIGDAFSDVLCRFRFGEGTYENGFEQLYGDVDSGNYATCEYGDDASAILRYFCRLEDGTDVELMAIFSVMELVEFLILRI